MKKQNNPEEVATLKAQLVAAQQEGATYRQQRDNITQQLQDLDAKSGIAINQLRAQLADMQTKLDAIPKKPTPGAFGGKA